MLSFALGFNAGIRSRVERVLEANSLILFALSFALFMCRTLMLRG